MFSETPLPNQILTLFQRLTGSSPPPIYVLGRNTYAERVARVFDVQAFVDDFTQEKSFLSKPVIHMGQLAPDSVVVSCVVDTVPLTGIEKLQLHGVREIIDFFSLSRLAPRQFGEMEHCAGNREDILTNAGQYEWVYQHLADETSKQHFAKVVQFRLNKDLNHMRGFKLAIDRQYFEDFLSRHPAEVFVDGGGYDGQNTIQLAAWNQWYRRVHYFEPAPQMMEVSRKRLAALRDIHFSQKGLFSRKDRLRFNADAGLAGSISSNGQLEIETIRLDDAVPEPITFLKLDIEGAEYDALQGAEQHIKAHTPTMAVCIYHNQQDFWRIPRQVLGMNDRYNVYVRHYTESVRETVMFFVPKK